MKSDVRCPYCGSYNVITTSTQTTVSCKRCGKLSALRNGRPHRMLVDVRKDIKKIAIALIVLIITPLFLIGAIYLVNPPETLINTLLTASGAVGILAIIRIKDKKRKQVIQVTTALALASAARRMSEATTVQLMPAASVLFWTAITLLLISLVKSFKSDFLD